jgi:hypothetical protein
MRDANAWTWTLIAASSFLKLRCFQTNFIRNAHVWDYCTTNGSK